MLCYESLSVTDIGNKRKVNQDNYIALCDNTEHRYIGIYCVADGMGGLSEGEYASGLATQKTVEWYKNNLPLLKKIRINENKLKESLNNLFYAINEKIYLYGKEKSIRIGTTYSLLLLIGNKYYVVHAGDSRIYLKRDGMLYMLTKDQTWVNEQVEQGLMSAQEALTHPKKNVLSNCMGYYEFPSVCTSEGKLLCGDSILLCSDGLYNLVTVDELSAAMDCRDLEYITGELLGLVKSRGGFDNITLLMLHIDEKTGAKSVLEALK